MVQTSELYFLLALFIYWFLGWLWDVCLFLDFSSCVVLGDFRRRVYGYDEEFFKKMYLNIKSAIICNNIKHISCFCKERFLEYQVLTFMNWHICGTNTHSKEILVKYICPLVKQNCRMFLMATSQFSALIINNY